MITEDWLAANGWKPQSKRNDGNTHLPGFRLRQIAHECLLGPKPFRSGCDLCIAVAPWPSTHIVQCWQVWIYQLEPYRHIFVRDMQTIDELIVLWEGLTGRKWGGT